MAPGHRPGVTIGGNVQLLAPAAFYDVLKGAVNVKTDTFSCIPFSHI